MKLKELAIDGPSNYTPLQLGGFSDGLSIVYGEKGSGKSTVRKFVRGTLFDFLQTGQHAASSQHAAGRLNVVHGSDEFQLTRDVHLNSAVGVRALTNTSPLQVNSLQQLAGNLDTELYDTIYSVSFRETPNNAIRMASVLSNQLGVPSGPETAGDETAFLNWRREANRRVEQLEALRARINSLSYERTGYLSQIESGNLERHSEVSEIERQIGQVIARINEIQASDYHEKLNETDREIAQLRLLIDNAQTQVAYAADVPSVDQHSALYQRLDEIDNQIRRWRHVQTDIQHQRVRLRDEMLIWNELTLDSDEHPYHNARAILVALESKVDEAERNANHWGETSVTRVDTSQMAESLSQLCNSMRSDLYGLCNELAQQYKHIRHKSAAAELKQLRRCYNEMGENIQRLIQRRESAIHEIRDVDPHGADAIVQSDIKFCECAQHSGYLEARRKFIGQVPSNPVTPQAYRSPAVDLSAERSRLSILEQQREEISRTIIRIDAEYKELTARHADLIRRKDQMVGRVNLQGINSKIQAINSELQKLNNEQVALSRLVEKDQEFVPVQPNSIIQRAGEFLNQFSAGDLTQVFLSQPIASTTGSSRSELQVRDRLGKVLNFTAIDHGYQDQAYLSLMLAVKENLQQMNIETPTIIDDAFSRIAPERVNATLEVLNKFSANRHQIIAFTQHRSAKTVPGLTILELPPTMPSVHPASSPVRHTAPAPVVVPTPIPEPDLYSTSFVSDDAYALSSKPRPYPLSKYPRSNSNYLAEEVGNTVAYPFPDVNSRPVAELSRPPLVSTSRSTSQNVSSVAVNTIGDRLGYVSSFDDSTRLDKAGFFDADQLRIFVNNGIESVGDLINLDVTQGSLFGLHVDQLDRWQAQLWLLINLPGLRVNDARVLVACGLTEPEQLDTSHPQQLFERIQRFFATSEGRRFNVGSDSITIERINGWYRSLDATRSRWQSGRSSYSRNRSSGQGSYRSERDRYEHDRNERPSVRAFQPRVREPRAARTYEPREYREREQRAPREHREYREREPRAPREPRVARPPRMSTPRGERKTVAAVAPVASLVESKQRSSSTKKSTKSTTTRKLKFYLDLNDHVEAAPSIGPKTAERFEKIGVQTVAEFFKQTAESMATKIDYKRITADVIRQWQHQARLVCRIPNLRGHDAQLLVACGITEPEELATMPPKSLFEIIGPFSETKEGLKIIRNGKKPDLAEITDWITWAEQTRSLQAA